MRPSSTCSPLQLRSQAVEVSTENEREEEEEEEEAVAPEIKSFSLFLSLSSYFIEE